LKRRGFSAENLLLIKRAYKTLYRKGLSLAEAKLELSSVNGNDVRLLTDFLNASTRGIIR
jgi:UDP-N-acetylglucosamine acyltransferase